MGLIQPAYRPGLQFEPPSAAARLSIPALILLGLGVLSAVGALTIDSAALWIAGAFLLPLGLGALGIDTVRLRTGWHPVIKVGVSIVIFLVAFVLLLIAVTLGEVWGYI